MFRDNALKARLQAGRKCLGCWSYTGSPILAEIAGLAGYDFVLIDHEHGPGDLHQTIGILQALSATKTTSLMRVPWNDAGMIKRARDTGAEGIMVPMVETADEAKRVVEACRFPPRGIRGSAGGMVRATDYGMRTEDYIARVEDQLMIICQIETPRGIDNVAAIAAVEGVDMLFVGPSDISASLGKPGRFDDPEVAAALEHVEGTIKEAGARMGTVARAGITVPELFERGYDLVSGGSDVSLFRGAALAQVDAHRKAHG